MHDVLLAVGQERAAPRRYAHAMSGELGLIGVGREPVDGVDRWLLRESIAKNVHTGFWPM